MGYGDPHLNSVASSPLSSRDGIDKKLSSRAGATASQPNAFRTIFCIMQREGKRKVQQNGERKAKAALSPFFLITAFDLDADALILFQEGQKALR